MRYQRDGLDLTVTGNRGVGTDRLVAAATELAAAPAAIDALLTHDVDLETGVDVMNTLCAERRRSLGDQLVLRLVVTLNAELVVP
ncbi:hypothetical protein [Nocardia sp. NPDC057353]|uniref:hypothetical protein n=1 Tax=Nocardia sp. NPDC057353 TaxID=3346104 RepID=UPI003638F04F